MRNFKSTERKLRMIESKLNKLNKLTEEVNDDESPEFWDGVEDILDSEGYNLDVITWALDHISDIIEDGSVEKTPEAYAYAISDYIESFDPEEFMDMMDASEYTESRRPRGRMLKEATEPKYELTDETMEWKGQTLHRIRALKDFGDVKAGDLGGWIESEDNLSHKGKCWVSDEAKVFGNAKVFDDAKVNGRARVFGNAKVFENAMVSGNAKIYDSAKVFGKAKVYDSTMVFGNTKIYDSAEVYEKAFVYENAKVYGYAWVFGNARVLGDAKVYGNAEVYEEAVVDGDVCICDDTKVHGDVEFGDDLVLNICGDADIESDEDIKQYRGQHRKIR